MDFSQVAFWEQWLVQKFLPMILDSQLHSPRVFKVHTSATEQRIFTVQFLVDSFSEYDLFQKNLESGIVNQIGKTFGNDVVCFTSFIQEVDIHV